MASNPIRGARKRLDRANLWAETVQEGFFRGAAIRPNTRGPPGSVVAVFVVVVDVEIHAVRLRAAALNTGRYVQRAHGTSRQLRGILPHRLGRLQRNHAALAAIAFQQALLIHTFPTTLCWAEHRKVQGKKQ